MRRSGFDGWQAMVTVGALLTLPCAALGHPGHGEHISSGSSLLSGLLHPLFGLDHLLAMLSVGLYASQLRGRAVWALPLAFVGLMVGGAVSAIAGVELPLVEGGIIASVLALGLLIAFAVRMPVIAASLLTGVFAVFHGHAHGSELVAGGSAFAYGVGFTVSTALLHVVAVAVGLAAAKLADGRAVRWAGGLVAASGVLLVAGM